MLSQELEPCSAERLALEHLVRLTWPSTAPEFPGSVNPAMTAARAWVPDARRPTPVDGVVSCGYAAREHQGRVPLWAVRQRDIGPFGGGVVAL